MTAALFFLRRKGNAHDGTDYSSRCRLIQFISWAAYFCAEYTTRCSHNRRTCDITDTFLNRYRLITHLQIGEIRTCSQPKGCQMPFMSLSKFTIHTNPDPRVVECVSACGIQQLPGSYEHGKNEESCYEVIEYYESRLFRHRIGAGRPMFALVCRAVLQDVMAALRERNRQDEQGRYIVHREIKPENILIRGTQPFTDNRVRQSCRPDIL